MDEHKLEQILRADMAPPADENARKRAVSLAMAAFTEEQKKKSEKRPQGFSIFSRLTGNTSISGRRETMERKTRNKLVYGGMATALALVLITGVSLTQVKNFSQITGDSGAVIRQEDERQSTLTAGAEAASPAYVVAVEAANEENPLQRWRRIQEEPAKTTVNTPPGSNAPAPSYIAQPPSSGELKKEKDGADYAIADKAIAGRASLAENMIVPASPPVQNLYVPIDPGPQPGYKDVGRDKFEDFTVNPFKSVAAEPVSTFSSDVDTASYSFVRRQLDNGVLPQKDAVRVEEMINYFHYNYPVPESREEPFLPTVTVTDSPWAQGKKLMHIGIKGYEITGEKPRSNLVFLLDVSGSMNSPDKLPLLKSSMKLLLDSLQPEDTVAIAVYAGAAGTVLEPTQVREKGKIIAAIDNLQAGGGTAGAQGIELAYQLAEEAKRNMAITRSDSSVGEMNAVNRVILATDGDFNVGITNPEELKDFVERKRETGIFLSVLGFGQGNYNDALMQTLAQNGNGTASYIDSLNEARKVLVDEASSTLFTIAKDVKFQVEFNPSTVAEYRLIGYETRHLNREDFNNDAVDAGDIGSGHTVTAIYEFVPVGSQAVSVDPLRYGSKESCTTVRVHADPNDASSPLVAKEMCGEPNVDSGNGEYAFVKIRYKLPDEKNSKLITTPVNISNARIWECQPCPAEGVCSPCPVTASDDIKFSTAVAAFAQILKGGKYTGNYTYDDVIALAQAGKGEDLYGYRAEFIQMVRMTKTLAR
ncbi:MAG: VWA domain-containing protein [Alphaproteobacteria bacterium]|nr:VWA domain-containing protein [Alphaproteobacteria bacterium]